MKTRTILAAAVAASVAVLAGCSTAPSTGPTGASTPGDGAIRIVASTNVYGSIAEAIGGDHVEVTSLIASQTQDPHEFEASARDQLTVGRAQLVLVNGGGYDPFMDGLVKASGTTADVLTAVDYSTEYADEKKDDDGEVNEHVFYDPQAMAALADALAAKLAALDPAGAADFTANAKAFDAGIGRIDDTLAGIDRSHHDAPIFVTEPLPLYLTERAELDDETPDAFSEAVEEGQDVPPAVLLKALRLIQNAQVKLVITNAQAGGPETEQVVAAAKDAGIPVLQFSELVPENSTYLDWMQANADALAKALG
ncbi:metal ABC transporter solute-binding protein, Zn/Mn family [Microbacterium luticocti]|uniref:metal ABC transporter solute-binding protein, Zn/Mn family n=1 Tax=Microbacterium luticocti TaxID=451764 RepID=UPI00041D25B6|nr:zinc ABC transporter substrate-binding protein [Microbacterium luticocti]